MLLQECRMEDIMDTSLGWQTRAVRYCTNALYDMERSIEPWRQPGLGGGGDPGCRALVKTQPHPLADVELQITMKLVVGSLHDILHQQQMLPNFSKELITVLQLLVDRDNPRQPRLVGHQGWWSMAVDHLEGRRLKRRLEVLKQYSAHGNQRSRLRGRSPARHCK